MNTDPEDIDLIERYINGQLTRAESMDFETRFSEDHEFARKVRLRKTFPSLFKAEGIDEIVMDVEEPAEIRFQRKKTGFVKPKGILWVAIVLLAVGVLCYFLFFGLIRPVVNTETKNPTARALSKAEKHLQSAVKTSEPQTLVKTVPLKTPAPVITIQKPITLEAPADGMVFERSEEILFRWKIATDTFTNFYVFSEASNKLAWWRGIRPGTRECIIPANRLSSGKFYWYIGTKEFMRTIVVSQ